MVSSPLVLARDQLVTLIEALTPPTDTGIAYRYFRDTDGRYFGDGQSWNRAFRFELISGGVIHDFGAFGAIQSHQLQLILRLSIQDLDPVDPIVNEAVLIQRAINEVQSWPTGVDMVMCERYRPNAQAKDDIDVIFEVTVRTQET